jgi:hypothetical protein
MIESAQSPGMNYDVNAFFQVVIFPADLIHRKYMNLTGNLSCSVVSKVKKLLYNKRKDISHL